MDFCFNKFESPKVYNSILYYVGQVCKNWSIGYGEDFKKLLTFNYFCLLYGCYPHFAVDVV